MTTTACSISSKTEIFQSLDEVIAVEEKKITFNEFSKEFPHAFLGEREGEYVERVANFLNKYSEPQHALIMDLLDLQWVAFVQQL